MPTIAESGFADYQAAAWYGFAVPKGTPPEIVAKLREATIASRQQARACAARLEFEGAEPVLNTPEEFAAFMQGESKRWAELIQTAGLTTD